MRKLLINSEQVNRLYSQTHTNPVTTISNYNLNITPKLSNEEITEKHVGREVLCVDARGVALTSGEIYTLAILWSNKLVCLSEKGCGFQFYAHRFKLIEQD